MNIEEVIIGDLYYFVKTNNEQIRILEHREKM